jgi:dihydroxyacetone kinase
MDLEPSILRSMIVRGTERIVAGSHDLCMLDLAIGDGDHGTNMTRGFQAVLAKVEEIVALPTGEALSAIGRTLVMTVGGASGPLYGSFFSPRAPRSSAADACLRTWPMSSQRAWRPLERAGARRSARRRCSMC